jgi:hypothetical protein
VEEPEGLQAFFHLMPGMAANLFKSFLEMTISQSLGISFGIPFEPAPKETAPRMGLLFSCYHLNGIGLFCWGRVHQKRLRESDVPFLDFGCSSYGCLFPLLVPVTVPAFRACSSCRFLWWWLIRRTRRSPISGYDYDL